jgi:GlpG protein
MRRIGILENRAKAETFVAFLTCEGIEAQLEDENNECEVWIRDEDQIPRALEEYASFTANPDADKYKGAHEKARKHQKALQERRQRIERRIVKISPSAHRQRRAPLVILLIVICGVVSLLTGFGYEKSIGPVTTALSFTAVREPDASKLVEESNGNLDALSLRWASISKGEVWRLFTPIFLHFDVPHLVFNMICLFYFGSRIEDRYGTVWLGVLILLAALFSNFMQATVPFRFDGSRAEILNGFLIHRFGGMSGVVYALVGFVWMKMLYDPGCQIFIPLSTIYFLIGWMVFCMTPFEETLLGNPVANWAHVIGLLVGMATGYLPGLVTRRPAT